MTNALLKRIAPQELEIVRAATTDYPVRVGELAARLGLRVTRSPLQPSVSGLIRPAGDTASGFEILVNKFETPERQRFTVAHEIGHYLLHRQEIGSGVIDNVMYRSGLSSKKEAEANQIAALIVMPPEAVEIELSRLGGMNSPDIAETLAERFRVSVPAMKVRLKVA
jgi:hypothetical protein